MGKLRKGPKPSLEVREIYLITCTSNTEYLISNFSSLVESNTSIISSINDPRSSSGTRGMKGFTDSKNPEKITENNTRVVTFPKTHLSIPNNYSTNLGRFEDHIVSFQNRRFLSTFSRFPRAFLRNGRGGNVFPRRTCISSIWNDFVLVKAQSRGTSTELVLNHDQQGGYSCFDVTKGSYLGFVASCS